MNNAMSFVSSEWRCFGLLKAALLWMRGEE